MESCPAIARPAPAHIPPADKQRAFRTFTEGAPLAGGWLVGYLKTSILPFSGLAIFGNWTDNRPWENNF
jgi:hypothetical protein